MGDKLKTNNKHHCSVAWNLLIVNLHKFKSFRVNTGNINNYIELKKRMYADSSQELCACLKLQFSNLPENTQIDENETLLLADKKHRDIIYERDDLKITLKLFIKDFDYNSVYDSILSTMNELKIDRIEQLIIAFPQPGKFKEIDSTNNNNNIQEKNDFDFFDIEWFANVLQLWKKIEDDFISTQKVFNVGVADFNLASLKALHEASRIKPCINHLNYSKCCNLSSELTNFARKNDIQLLTHNDPQPFPLKDVFHSFCNCNKDEKENKCLLFEPTWAARYTFWVRRRSIMAARGYIVQFKLGC